MIPTANNKFRVTPRALADLKNIGRYTQQVWGKTQRNIYLKQFETRFQWLTNNPLSGKHRSDICEGYYSFQQGQHVVFYLIKEDAIDIIGLPHKRMDIISYFEDRYREPI